MDVKEMCWLSTNSNNATKVLHVRKHKQAVWLPYYKVTECAIPDYKVPGGSQGYAAMQYLMKQGWTLVPSPQTDLD